MQIVNVQNTKEDSETPTLNCPKLNTQKSFSDNEDLPEETYFHRCPYGHDCHTHYRTDGTLSPAVPSGLEITLDEGNRWCHEASNRLSIETRLEMDRSRLQTTNSKVLENSQSFTKDEKEFHGLEMTIITRQCRQRAIFYLLKRMGVHPSRDSARVERSVIALEQCIYEQSHSKESYIQNLASKVDLLLYELKRIQFQKSNTRPTQIQSKANFCAVT